MYHVCYYIYQVNGERQSLFVEWILNGRTCNCGAECAFTSLCYQLVQPTPTPSGSCSCAAVLRRETSGYTCVRAGFATWRACMNMPRGTVVDRKQTTWQRERIRRWRFSLSGSKPGHTSASTSSVILVVNVWLNLFFVHLENWPLDFDLDRGFWLGCLLQSTHCCYFGRQEIVHSSIDRWKIKERPGQIKYLLQNRQINYLFFRQINYLCVGLFKLQLWR